MQFLQPPLPPPSPSSHLQATSSVQLLQPCALFHQKVQLVLRGRGGSRGEVMQGRSKDELVLRGRGKAGGEQGGARLAYLEQTYSELPG